MENTAKEEYHIVQEDYYDHLSTQIPDCSFHRPEYESSDCHSPAGGAVMNDSIFREKSIKKVQSPDNLNEFFSQRMSGDIQSRQAANISI